MDAEKSNSKNANALQQGKVMTVKNTSQTKHFSSIAIKDDQIVERFTGMANYKSFYQKYQSEFCTNISDQIKRHYTPTVEELRIQHNIYKQKALQHRQELLEQLKLFRETIESVISEHITLLRKHYQSANRDRASLEDQSKRTL